MPDRDPTVATDSRSRFTLSIHRFVVSLTALETRDHCRPIDEFLWRQSLHAEYKCLCKKPLLDLVCSVL